MRKKTFPSSNHSCGLKRYVYEQKYIKQNVSEGTPALDEVLRCPCQYGSVQLVTLTVVITDRQALENVEFYMHVFFARKSTAI